MSKKQALQAFNQELHISHNQIFNYLNCSLKYMLHYIENRPMERISIALFFGSAIHAAIEIAVSVIEEQRPCRASEGSV